MVKLTINFEGSNRPNHDHGRQRLRHVVRARAEYMLMPTEYYRTSVPGSHKSMYPQGGSASMPAVFMRTYGHTVRLGSTSPYDER